MEESFLEKIIKWQRAGRRIAEIHFGSVFDPDYFKIYVYDVDLGAGQIFHNEPEFDAMDLKKSKLEYARNELARLEAEYAA